MRSETNQKNPTGLTLRLDLCLSARVFEDDNHNIIGRSIPVDFCTLSGTYFFILIHSIPAFGMPHQLNAGKTRKQAAAVVRSKKMATAWLCLSTSFATGAHAAFIRHSASRSAAFASHSSLVGKAARSSSRWFHTPSALAASTAVDTKTSNYDLINKERGLDSYTPSDFEKEIYSWWEDSGCFQPDAKQKPTDEGKKPYVLPMPPPNVTGRLHMGHAIFVALQDVLARFHRMRGRPVLWLPGGLQPR